MTGTRSGRLLHGTRSHWEFRLGYSRAVRQGDLIRVSGTAGLDEHGDPVEGGAGDQARKALEIVEEALKALGADFGDVIMSRIYVRDASDMEEVSLVHGQIFRDLRPAMTLIQAAFIDHRILVEFEMEAVVGAKDG